MVSVYIQDWYLVVYKIRCLVVDYLVNALWINVLCCVFSDNSFGWGVGVGIMYMMSAGTAEISKLNTAMDETVKTVQELKAEISIRKNAQNVNASVAENEAKTSKMSIERSYNNPVLTRIGAKNEDNIKAFSGGYASSILSDNQQPEVLEMHQLEAELESELQKLPWCAMEASSSEGRTDVFEVTSILANLNLDLTVSFLMPYHPSFQ